MNKEANTRQVGGEHYGLREFQHWDMVEDFGMGYLEGCATKYLARWRDKGGLKDLEKANHYVQKLIEVGRGPRGNVPLDVIKQFCQESNLDWRGGEAACLMVLCHGWLNVQQLEDVRSWISELKSNVTSTDSLEPLPLGALQKDYRDDSALLRAKRKHFEVDYPFGFDPELDIPPGPSSSSSSVRILAVCFICGNEITDVSDHWRDEGRDVCSSCTLK